MARWFLVSALAVFVGESSGALPFVEAGLCNEPCPDDGDQECSCPVGCYCCSCCSHSMRSLALDQARHALLVPLARAPAIERRDLPPSPEPGDILHVPRASLP